MSGLSSVIAELCQMSAIPYSTILLSGADAEEFLQGQLTADLRELADAGPLRSAWCNPKGRVICIMMLAEDAGGFALTLPAELAEHVVQRLTMFRFRSKVDFEIRPATERELAEWGSNHSFEEWRLGQLRAGVPEIFGAQSEQFTAHMLNLDLLGAVSLDKGCYTGQEIISRTHYRGASKRRLHRFESAKRVSPGDKVSEGDRNVGEVVNAIGCDLLAVVPVDKADASLAVGSTTLTHIPLNYP
jgi:tRNA-modifying protein YgfZ